MRRALAVVAVAAACPTPALAGTRDQPADLVVVVDDSPAAANFDPSGARWAAVDAVRRLLGPHDRIGVVSYGVDARLRKPLTAPDDDLPPQGWGGEGGGVMGAAQATADATTKVRPMQGLTKALEALGTAKPRGAEASILLVLSGDEEPAPPDEIDAVISKARNVGAAVYGYRRPRRSDAASTDRIVKATGGESRRFKEERQLPMMFQTWFDRFRRDTGMRLSDGRVPVDPTVEQLRLVADTAHPELVVVYAPDGERLKAHRDNGPGVVWSDTIDGAMIVVDKPKVGTWRIEGAGKPVRGWLESKLALVATVPNGLVVAGDPVLVSAFLARGGQRIPVGELPAGLVVTTTIPESKDPNSYLRDDGDGADRAARDGEFWGSIAAPHTPGEHEVVVRASAVGFFRRAVATLDVTLGGEAPVPIDGDPDRPALVHTPPGLPSWALPALLGLLAATALLVLLWRRGVRVARRLTAQIAAARAEEEPVDPEIAPLGAGEVEDLLAGHFKGGGFDVGPLPSEGPPGKPTIMILDFYGEFEARVRQVVGTALEFWRVVDARSCRQQLRDRRPALLVIVDPVKGATVPALLRWIRDETGLTQVPVVRVAREVNRVQLRQQLAAGTHDVMIESDDKDAHAESVELLRRIARALRTHAAQRAERERNIAPEKPKVRKLPEKVELRWVAGRVEDVPVPLRISLADGGDTEAWDGEERGMLIDVVEGGILVACKSLTDEGRAFVFESELFTSLALDGIAGTVSRLRRIDHADWPYVWDVDYTGLDPVHRRRILTCYEGLLSS